MNNTVGILIILGIIFLGIYGGTAGKNSGPLIKLAPITGTSSGAVSGSSNQTLEQKIKDAQKQVDDLKKKIDEEERKKTESKYKGKISIFINRSTNPSTEYITINNRGTTTIPVTGWRFTSTSTNQSVQIPQATYLFFADTQNSEEDIYLAPGETLYLITGRSPNGSSFKTNKCSGYLSQFQSFTPSLSYSCPAPRNEDTSSIPRTLNNDACLDYIERMPSCQIQTKSLPANWSYECTKFIYDKINYPSCVNIHKNDKDFYGKDWRVYLKRSERLWKDRRETIILYDNEGKIVTKYSY